MSLNQKIIVLASLLGASVASAQAASASGTPGTATAPGIPAVVNIELYGTIQSSLQLVVNGNGYDLTSGTASDTASSSGTFNLGTFNPITFTGLNGNARGNRVTSGGPGSFVRAPLRATLSYNGASTGDITVSRGNDGADNTSPIADANLRVQTGTAPAWTTPTSGTNIARTSTFSICNAPCASGSSIAHEVGLYIPDSQAAGTFSAVVVYTGTAQ